MQSLTGRVGNLLGWLKDTEVQMEQEAASSEDGRNKEKDKRTVVWLTQELQQVKVNFIHTRILNKNDCLRNNCLADAPHTVKGFMIGNNN